MLGKTRATADEAFQAVRQCKLQNLQIFYLKKKTMHVLGLDVFLNQLNEKLSDSFRCDQILKDVSIFFYDFIENHCFVNFFRFFCKIQ